MLIRNRIESLYQNVIRRLFSRILPITIFLTYLSAYSIKEISLFSIIKRIELVTLHYLIGIVLTLLLITVFYHFINLLLVSGGLGKTKEKFLNISNYNRKITPNRIVEFLFYGSLAIVCTIGMLLYMSKHTGMQQFLSVSNRLIVLHDLAGWFFLSVVFLKYYLLIARWYENIIRYLREV